MNGIDIFKGIADLLVQVLMLFIYVPKTLFKILKNPEWVPQYITETINNKTEHQDYVPPVFLYIITALVPYAIVPAEILREIDTDATTVIDILQNNATLIRGAIFLIIPLIFAFLTELFKSATFSRNTLVRYFSIHCYYFAPLILAIQIHWVLSILVKSDNGLSISPPILWFIFLATLLWLLVVQFRFLKNELGGNWLKIFFIIILGALLTLLATNSIVLKLNLCGGKSKELIIGLIVTISITMVYGTAFISYVFQNLKKKTRDNSD